MSQGYDQFFKAAKAAKAGTRERPTQRGPSLKKRGKTSPTLIRRRARFPWGAFSVGLILLSLMAGLSTRPEVLDFLLTRVQVKWGSSALANQDRQKNPGLPAGTRQEVPGQGTEPVSMGSEMAGDYSLEELNHFSRLAERKQQLDQREAQLNRLEEELHRQKDEIDARIRQLEETRRQIAGVLKDRVETDRARVDRLVEVYSNMRPQQAAQIIANLNDDLAVEILGSMKRQNAAEILNVLDPEKAQSLTERFAGYKR